MDSKKFKEMTAGKDVVVPTFDQYVKPHGMLDNYLETHCCFFYYLNAYRTYEEHIKNKQLVYEGDKDPEYNFWELFKSTAALYGCDPEYVANAWPVVDQQCMLLGIPILPDKYKYPHHGLKGSGLETS